MKTILVAAMLLARSVSGALAADEVIPQMRECMKAHGSQQEYLAALKKYCDPGIIQQAMGLLVIKNPYVVKTDKEGEAVCYTVEGTTVETSSEIPADMTQTYRVCWGNGRVISLQFFGPKYGLQEDIIPEMRECMRAHDSKEAYAKVLEKYCDPGIIRRAMGLLVIKEPYVTQVEKDGPVITYTVRGRTVETSSEIPADTVQMYKVGWKSGRVVSLEFLGPAGGVR